MRSIARRTLVALAAATALAVAGCGEDDTTADAPAPGNGIDRAFVAEMVPHHQSAIDMAKIAGRRADSAFVTRLAADILASQSREIAAMQREDRALAGAGVKTGSLGVPAHMMGMDGSVSALRTADPFDAAFLTAMIPHHEGAIPMAQAEIARGADPELKALARSIIDVQRREIAAMRKQLGAAGSGEEIDDAGHGAGHNGE